MSLACGLAVGRDTPYFIPKLDRALDINKEENGKNKKKNGTMTILGGEVKLSLKFWEC